MSHSNKISSSVLLCSCASLFILVSAKKKKKWALNEEFNGDPSSPSQDLLPRSFSYCVTHRTHPKEHFSLDFDTFLADHDNNCAGPDPNKDPVPQHLVRTSHNGTSANPDPSIYICKNHIMTAMGDVSPYSIVAFYPRQLWDFSKGGKLEFDVSNNGNRDRHWWEVMVVPRSLLSIAAGPEWAPIDEHYPTERLVFSFNDGFREMQVGTAKSDPDGRIGFRSEQNPWLGPWGDRYPEDPSLYDRRIQVRHRFKISKGLNKIQWLTKKPDGKWAKLKMKLKEKVKMPFTQAIVIFKTHSYTPEKANNYDDYTDHWDNIRFSGPVTGKFDSFSANDTIYLQYNGDSFVGNEATNAVALPNIAGRKATLFGQAHQPVKGEVQLSINGGPFVEVRPYSYTDDCATLGWKSFQVSLDGQALKVGENTFRWVIGKRTCESDLEPWIGFSIKCMEVHVDQ